MINKTWIITKKLLLDSKKSLIWVTIAGLALGGMYVSIFPSIVDAGFDLNEIVEQMPPAFAEIFSLADADLTDFEVYMSVEYFSIFWAVVFLPFVINWSVQLSKEAEKGTLALTLSYPITRTSIVIANHISLAIRVLLTTTIIIATILIPAYLLDIKPDLPNWIKFGGLLFLMIWSVGSIGILFSTLFLKTSKAISLVAGIVAIGYFLNILSKLVDTLEFTKYFSIFYYLGDPMETLNKGNFDAYSIVFFLTAIFFSIILSLYLFRNKDLSVG